MKEKKKYFREPNQHVGFWTMCYSLFTAVLVAGTLVGAVIGVMQLNSISETSKAEFILKFKDGFFKKESRDLMIRIDTDSLRFVLVDSIPYFVFRNNNIDTVISAYEVDELLLNHFDDIGMFEKKGILALDMVDNMFGWYIEECWEDSQISAYIKFERSQYGNQIFRDFENIYNKCRNLDLQQTDTSFVNKKKK